jgi:hypothetical protein
MATIRRLGVSSRDLLGATCEDSLDERAVIVLWLTGTFLSREESARRPPFNALSHPVSCSVVAPTD